MSSVRASKVGLVIAERHCTHPLRESHRYVLFWTFVSLGERAPFYPLSLAAAAFVVVVVVVVVASMQDVAWETQQFINRLKQTRGLK